jgi:predicted MFS family arabinose efflux permease
MNRQFRLLLITFTATLVETLAWRGSYFFLKEQFLFTDEQNLLLAVSSGMAAVIGALMSARISRWLSPRYTLITVYVLLVFICVIQAIWTGPVTICIGTTCMMLLMLITWPILESYLSAGLSALDISRSIGRFNITWAIAMPLGMISAGPLIQYIPRGLYVLPAVLVFIPLLLAFSLEQQPQHLSKDHDDRPDGPTTSRYYWLMIAARWTMLLNTSLGISLAPLLPGILKGLGVKVVWATAVAGVQDALRLFMFIIMQRTTRWHNRGRLLAMAIIGLIIGVTLIYTASNIWMVVAGQILIGACGPMTYYIALYYAMLVHNASVEAGGAHEGVAALGLAVGPGAVILGTLVVGATLGPIVGLAPICALCSIKCVRSLHRARFRPAQ